ncbi:MULTISPECIES: TetR/AcrR family transcriptional regulator [unclassified Arthrobacter]|uniref:TetR/AcrR family transcriptional regulator n=1 Tax=unclassified Arthrobacter TaxID=235627 RepID=UPI0002DBF3C4|nr:MULTISPECIES: TetR/AcrR family transcriptional regulator [unclassified Arthrobacter]
MARPPNPERKTELLDQILDYLLDKTFAGLSFRTLADGLGISSYVLVYHFGNREELVNQIVTHIERRDETVRLPDPSELSREEFREWSIASWKWTQIERNRQLQRLEFEASLHDAVSPTPRESAVAKFDYWHGFIRDWLLNQGVPADRADAVARVHISGIYGLQYDFVVNRDRPAAEAALLLLMDYFFDGLDRALDQQQ